MKKIDIGVLNNRDDIQGLYFFTQCLNELLFDHTNDSYKAPALNLVSRVMELELMAKHVEQSEIHSEALRPFIDEVKWGIGTDPVLTEKCRLRLTKGVERISQGTPSVPKVISFSAWAKNELFDYFEKLKEKIIQIVPDSQQKRLIRQLAISFAAHVELRSYSRRYAFQQVMRNLKRKLNLKIHLDIEGTLKAFFDDFNGTTYSSKVYFRGEGTFSEFEKLADNWGITIRNEVPENIKKSAIKNHFNKDEKLKVFIEIDRLGKIKDRYQARTAAERKLNRFIGMIKYHCHNKSLCFSDNAIVTLQVESEEDNKDNFSRREMSFFIKKNPNPTLNRFDDGQINIAGIERLAELIEGKHLDLVSTRKFNNTLEYHRNALTAPSLVHQLISLWSALEGLLPHPESGVRIKHFTEIVSNILVLSYPKKLFGEIARQLKTNLDPVEILKIEAIGLNSWIENVIALIVCSENITIRDDIVSTLDDHPLLRFRITELFETFSDIKKITKTLESHKTKISWHINRIYMSRNLIVHSAESMPYLEIIVENLHDYLDTVIDSISYYAIDTKIKISIDSIVDSILTDYALRIEHLSSHIQSKTILNNSNFLDFIHGKIIQIKLI